MKIEIFFKTVLVKNYQTIYLTISRYFNLEILIFQIFWFWNKERKNHRKVKVRKVRKLRQFQRNQLIQQVEEKKKNWSDKFLLWKCRLNQTGMLLTKVSWLDSSLPNFKNIQISLRIFFLLYSFINHSLDYEWRYLLFLKWSTSWAIGGMKKKKIKKNSVLSGLN